LVHRENFSNDQFQIEGLLPMKAVQFILTTLAIGALNGSQAHHSFAMFDLTQHRLYEGRVTAWNYNSPHSWLHIESTDASGETQSWSFEGAAPVHATRQGVNGNTYRKGELVRVVASPLRDGRNAGAMCFVVKEDGSTTQPNDGICNSTDVIAAWRSNGWLDDTRHLQSRPTGN
jgi:hypothetical protein